MVQFNYIHQLKITTTKTKENETGRIQRQEELELL